MNKMGTELLHQAIYHGNIDEAVICFPRSACLHSGYLAAYTLYMLRLRQEPRMDSKWKGHSWCMIYFGSTLPRSHAPSLESLPTQFAASSQQITWTLTVELTATRWK